MPQADRYEVLVLGSGTGGKLMTWHMAQSGRRTAVVEQRWIGGSCPNIACMPSKNEISSARVAYLTRNAAQFGTTAGPVAIDMRAVRQRKREMVERQVATHLQIYKASGAELIMGSCVKKTRERHAVRKMKEDPSEPSCRGRLQTAISCFGQKPRW